MTSIDPDLIGIWIAPGHPATFEVDPDGGYHVAEPEMPLRFEDRGTVMIWGDKRLERQLHAGETPIGQWIDRDHDEIWSFDADRSYTITAGGLTDTGIWALRDGGAALWARERTARVEADGATVVFQSTDGTTLRYNYTVSDGVWKLLDAADWTELATYIRPDRLAIANER